MPASRRPERTPPERRLRVVVVGSGWHFLSGISYYTCRLSNALAGRFDVGAVLMRRLLPRRLYPGRSRVGERLSQLSYAPEVAVFDGVDWWSVPSLVRALAFLHHFRPDVLVLQWWTGTVLHNYLALALLARATGVRVVVEFHEVQDTGEVAHRWAARYVRTFITPLLRCTDGVIVHSGFDREALRRTYGLTGVPDEIALHGPFDHHATADTTGGGSDRLLFFGTIRPYKGLEDLIEAFALLPANFTLTVVGETWEGWDRPASLIAESPARDRITFVNRYVTDAEVDDYFAAADIVVLPYHRSSASGPLHIAMSHGVPVVVTSVGGLVEAASRYSGTVFVPAGSPPSLADGIREAAGKTGKRHTDPSSWEQSVAAFARLFERIGLQDAEMTTSSNQTVPELSPDLR